MSTCGKKSWSTEEYAERALADIHRRPHPGGRRLELRTYHCRECGHYHLTSKADRYWERPSQAELWRRHQVALDLLASGDPTVLDKVRRALLGKTKDAA